MTIITRMKGHTIARLLLSSLLLTGIFQSCEKEKDTASPAYKIAQSEKLVIPSAIQFPDSLPNQTERIATYYAEGIQKYKAQVKAGSFPVQFEWVFVAPDAKLYDRTNKIIGTHGAGPFWQLSPADSVFGQAFTPAKTAPSPDAGSIDWLLLKTRTDKPRTGIFTNVHYIQRIATTGGKAPVVAPVDGNATAEVPYTAIYRFTRRIP
jgi:hypothetical protein